MNNNNNEFASSNLTAGQLNAIVKDLGGEEGARKFLRGEVTVSEPARNWREHDGVIYFTVISDGTTGSEWITRFEQKGIRLSDYAKSLLLSPDFRPTSGIVYQIAVLKGMLFNDNERFTKNIRQEAGNRQLTKPSPEVACLIRWIFTDEEIKAMGLDWITAMHEPIKDSAGDLILLSTDCDDDDSWLDAYYVNPDRKWNRRRGFAFVVSQVLAQGIL